MKPNPTFGTESSDKYFLQEDTEGAERRSRNQAEPNRHFLQEGADHAEKALADFPLCDLCDLLLNVFGLDL